MSADHSLQRQEAQPGRALGQRAGRTPPVHCRFHGQEVPQAPQMAVDKGRENPAERLYHLLIVISGLSGTVPRPLVAAQPPQPVSFQPPCTCSPLNFKQAPKWVGTGGHNGPWALPGHQGRKQPGDQRPGGGGVSDPEKPEKWQGAGYLMAACQQALRVGTGQRGKGGV